MLTANPPSEDQGTSRPVAWIDLLNPTDTEKTSVESKYGLKLPSRQELSEIESSSRISERNGVLYLSMPIVSYAGALDESPLAARFCALEGCSDHHPLHAVAFVQRSDR